MDFVISILLILGLAVAWIVIFRLARRSTDFSNSNATQFWKGPFGPGGGGV